MQALTDAVCAHLLSINPFQVYEARAYGADTVLLIVKMLPDDCLADLMQCARALRMEPLVRTAAA
jgi:indole-3-glycerol phosphate synthase